MALSELRNAIDRHSGTFHCVEIGAETRTKVVHFAHRHEPASSLHPDFSFEPLRAFYETFAHLTLYHDPASGEAAFHIAAPDQWEELDVCFRPWLGGIDEEEERDLLPDWIGDCLVIGEIPQSGNYLLVPVAGECRGFVFEFEHDGFEFIERASTIEQFVLSALELDESSLTRMASHLRFIEDDPAAQWWIGEMRDSRGAVIRTRT